MALDCASLLLLSKTQQLTNTARVVGQKVEFVKGSCLEESAKSRRKVTCERRMAWCG